MRQTLNSENHVICRCSIRFSSITVTLTSRLPNPLVFLHVSVTEDSDDDSLASVVFVDHSSAHRPARKPLRSRLAVPGPIVYIWIQEIKRHCTTWLYVSFIVYRDIFALRVHLFFFFYAGPNASVTLLRVRFSITSWFSSCKQQDGLTKGKLTSGYQLEWWRKTNYYDDYYKWCIWLHSDHKQYSSRWSNLWIFTSLAAIWTSTCLFAPMFSVVLVSVHLSLVIFGFEFYFILTCDTFPWLASSFRVAVVQSWWGKSCDHWCN